MLNDFGLYSFYSQIWLNLGMEDNHFGYITKLPRKTLICVLQVQRLASNGSKSWA
jgi:hypothetical protein